MASPPSRSASPAETDHPLRELRGVVERIPYQNLENGHTVARLLRERTNAETPTTDDERLTTVVGTLADLTPGETIVAGGGTIPNTAGSSARWSTTPPCCLQCRA